ncbi:acetyl-coenzyme A synthetase, cytoplasmic-like [Zophobas morio]|uniref:acetyl-coenzyme A synthetase, cytoplasmic-like n=1 Tax=Zophobas morio TaxID=2755281 RepID=UPI003082B28A
MSSAKVHPKNKMDTVVDVPFRLLNRKAHINSIESYRAMHTRSIKDPEKFWGEVASEFYWNISWKRVLSYNFNVRNGPIFIKWFEGGKTNICYNALDRHIQEGKGERVVFYFEGNEPNTFTSYTYRLLLQKVCKFSNALLKIGVKKGDRVIIYMPMIIELIIAVLGCARIGAVHSVVFGGFSSEALAIRIVDAGAECIITADGILRGPKQIPLIPIVQKAIGICKDNNLVVSKVILKNWVGFKAEDEKFISWDNLVDTCKSECSVEWLDSEDPLFLLYTSGSTGTPKGVLHSIAGYMVYASLTHRYAFDYHEGDVFWCTADIGWITGHTYTIYGPLLNGATSILFEGIPTYPDGGRFWSICEKYAVTQFYTAPTAIRSLMGLDSHFLEKHDLSSLRVLGTVGESINSEAWLWYYKAVGKQKCAVVDTYWQTETGGLMVSPLPGAAPAKPGSCALPFFGVQVQVLNPDGTPAAAGQEGCIVFDRPWPGIMRTIFKDHNRFEKSYFSVFPGHYTAGDSGFFDEDGYLWVVGRIDDVMSVSGHRIGASEVENAIALNKDIAEVAAVGIDHEVKGQSIWVFCVLRPQGTLNEELTNDLKLKVRQQVGAFATPERIVVVESLPKTRSGKIMRRLLRDIFSRVKKQKLGDCSTVSEPQVIKNLVKQAMTLQL